ncbi:MULTISPECIES: NAD(P)/FAD-dependent oxidoreductase [unclassified Bacillus (in: firmicutes)]|uniref:NAD(P)/FAD-dependent oxidoreductase n=1 Tax=unclassified Bacillus (in: firmicutes) TaxID=185979 RepID=UPI0023306613|nr:FAD-dependent oxidoreductase [Bacillus sp. BP-3]MDC2864225.1 FAD-dependent oxidoreductase [Bacillus sp. BP-3]
MKHIVILGGGFAGINLLNGLKKELGHLIGREVKITLVDKNSFHFRKVLLFKSVVEDADLKVPLKRYCTDGVEFVKGEAIACNHFEKEIEIKLEDEGIRTVQYDYLVLALGSVIQEIPSTLGGTTLSSVKTAVDVRQKLLSLIQLAKTEENKDARRELLRIAIVGGGITGIETSAEICVWFKKEVQKVGLNPDEVEVILFDSKEHLLRGVPVKVSERLTYELKKIGIKCIPKTRVKKFENGQLLCTNGTIYAAGECVWTPGVKVNPIIQTFQLPLSNENQILVTDTYSIKGYSHIYAIGDCARVVDQKTNQVDGMTCKEAIPQATRLGKILKNEIYGISNSVTHKAYPVKLYCISLGPNNGFVWVQKWGMDFILSGKIGARIREKTWDQASLLV